MKKIISIILAVIMVISMTACTNNKSSVSLEEVKQMAEKEIPDIGLMLGDNWDGNTLPKYYFSLIGNTQYLYNRDNGEEIPKVAVGENRYLASEGIELDVLIPAITKYYPFSEKMLRDSFEKSLIYDSHTDAVLLTDGFGWSMDAVMHDVTDNQDGTYDISYGLYAPEDILEYTGVVKVKVHPDGYLQFISNTINRRVFDYMETEAACERILYLFGITAGHNWDKNNSTDFLKFVDAAPFRYIVESLYRYDCNTDFENIDGYANVDSYVTYGTKYFDFDADDIRSALESSYTYNAENDTVLMSDGLGTAMGLKITEFEQNGEIYTVHYDIIYFEGEPDAGEMTFKINEDGSFKFLSGKFIEKVSSQNEITQNIYPLQFEAEKLTKCLVHSMDKTAYEENRAKFGHRELLIRLSCVESEDFRYTPMLPLNSNYNKEFGVSVCEDIIYDVLGETTDVHSYFDINTYNAERDLYEFSTDFGSGSKYAGKNFEYSVEDSGLNCSVSFDLYEEQDVNGDPALVNIGKCKFKYRLLTDKNCWQFTGFEKI